MAKVTKPALAKELLKLAENKQLLYEVARLAVEDVLVDFRDSRISFPGRNNGLVIKEKDRSPSDVIRMPIETAISIALKALADHLDPQEKL